MSNNNNAIGGHVSSDLILPNSDQSWQEVAKPTQTYSPSEEHMVEWCERSGVSEAIARLGPKPLNDRKVIAHRTGWKNYPDYFPLGWWISGLDLTTMKPQAFGQFKPKDEIQLPGEDKPLKYISDKGHPYDAIALRHPDKDFWQRVLDDVSIIVDLDEGAKKSGAGMTCGLPSLALPGVTMWQIKGELVPNLKVLAVPGRTFRVRFDMDVQTKKEVRLEVKKLVKALEKRGCNALVAMWNKELGLKIDDVLVNHGPETVKKIMADAIPYSQWLKNLEAQFNSTSETLDTGNSKPPSNSKNKRLLDLIETHWGQRLRFNEMTQQVELNGKTDLDIERVYLRLADELGIDIPKQTAVDLVLVTAQKYAYSPVRDYLNSLANVTPIDLDSLAERWFGTKDPLHATYLKKTLIAGVARVFEPGCKVDTLLILQGIQGLLKSLCLQTLAGKGWFTDSLNDSNEKDEKMKLKRYWMLEYSEFETVYKRKEVSQLKAFLSSPVDSLRVPYGKAIQDFPRSSIFVGTTNKQEILNDETGSRRDWILPVQQTIPIKTVEAERDGVWAAAVAAYKAGEQWWLTPEEDELRAEANKSWQASDTWEASILNYLQLKNKSSTTVAELLTEVIRLDLAQQKKAEQMRVSEVLCRNGWSRVAKRIDGKLQKCWEKKVVTGGNGVVTEVVTAQNPLSEPIVEIVLPPVTTFLAKKSQSASETDEITPLKSQETFENEVVTSSPSDSENLLEQGLNPVTTPPVTTSPISPQLGKKHKEFNKGDRVVIVEVGSLHEGRHGEVLYVEYGSSDIDYTVKLDKESHGNQRVRVTVPHYSKLTFLMKL